MAISASRGLSRFARDRRPEGDPWALRVSRADSAGGGDFVLYWCHSYHRVESNLAFELAVARANATSQPLLMVETVDRAAPGVTRRKARFVADGAERNRRDAESRGATHRFYAPDAGDEMREMLRVVSARASCVIIDDYPTREVRQLVQEVSNASGHGMTTVDDNGLFPIRAAGKEHYSARFFRDFSNRVADDFFFTNGLDSGTVRTPFSPLQRIPDDQTGDSPGGDPPAGGRDAALARLKSFVATGLHGYSGDRNRRVEASSGLSPFLRWGFVSAREIVAEVLRSGAAEADVDAFLEQLVIRRELAFNMCHFNEQHDSLRALPEWARRTLDSHRHDRRSPIYSFEQMESAETADEVWNAAQRELLTQGTIHNYLRMVWGKRIMEWSESPEEAHETMLALHDRYALDARDPNTHAGILWCFGKHDRPWFPERPVFGTIRYMSSEAARRKIAWRAYESRFGRPRSPQ